MIIAPSDELVYRQRDPAGGDDAYIFKTWKATYRHSPMTKHVPNDIYWDMQDEIVERLLNQSTTLIATNPAALDQIYGFITFAAPNILHFIAVKRLYWRFGLGRGILRHALPSSIIQCSHWHDSLEVWKPGVELVYNPRLQGG